MSSRTVTTPTTPAPPRARSGFNLGTLLIAAISAVVAATVVSRLWQAGTVMATAMTPVVIALVKEGLERPAQRVTAIAVRPPRVPGEAPPPPPVVVTDEDGMTPMRVYRPGSKRRRRWKLAIATGLLAFAIAVATMTLPELVAGRSVVSASHDTTIFGGRRNAPATTTKQTEQKKTTSTGETVTTEKQKPQDTTSIPQQTTTTTPVQPVQPAPQTQQAPAPQTQTQPPPATTQPPPEQQQPAPTTP